jgi:hypothetical protein
MDTVSARGVAFAPTREAFQIRTGTAAVPKAFRGQTSRGIGSAASQA